MKKFNDAIRRQRAVQRSRTIAWALFAVFVPIALLFGLEVVFGLLNFDAVGLLQLLAEAVLALLFTLAAVQMFRAGVHFNQLHADPDRLLNDDAESELATASWSTFLPFWSN